MKRKDFLKNFATLGLGLSFFSTLLSSCDKGSLLPDDLEVNFRGKVLIIGAGAAGMTAAYLLKRYGIDFEILEAAPTHGGRIKKLSGFVDFPIDLGGEWIHTDPKVMVDLIDDEEVSVDIDIITYNPQTFQVLRDGELRSRNFANQFYSEYKFKNTTWFDFFDQYMVPHIRDRIRYERPVVGIDYSGERVVVEDATGTFHEADKVLVTVPISILKQDLINFQPTLPTDKVEALATIDYPPILKVFMEFSERFYPDILIRDGLFEQNNLLYDAAFGKDSDHHVLGLFCIGEDARAYVDLESDEAVLERLLAELDAIYEGRASQTYRQGVVQNWSKEPYIRGSYSHFQEGYRSTIDTLIEPIDGKVYFAGEAMNPVGQTSTVHGAGESAYVAIEKLVQA
ncbi:MAG: NAD(P)/FAD-dependent oxidoreductase [Bacteroidota bacterium]